MIKNRKLTLEQRIARLERVLKNEAKSSRDVITKWFDDNFGPENFDNKRAWMRALKYLADRADDISVTDCADETGEDYDEITDKLADLAKEALNDIKYNKAHGSDVVARVWTDPWQ